MKFCGGKGGGKLLKQTSQHRRLFFFARADVVRSRPEEEGKTERKKKERKRERKRTEVAPHTTYVRYDEEVCAACYKCCADTPRIRREMAAAVLFLHMNFRRSCLD